MERYKYVINVELAVVRGDKFLITVRSEDEDYAPGVLAYPGGKVEPGTVGAGTLEETAKRELLEETGLTVRRLEYLESKSFEMQEDTFVMDVVFLAEVEEGEARVQDPRELTELHWLTAEEILENRLTPEWLASSVRLAQERTRDRQPGIQAFELDHVQVTMPRGAEADARAFYGELLGLPEVEKPEPLRARGGAWFELGVQQLHVSVEEPFSPAKKAHPGLVAAELDALAARLTEAGHELEWDEARTGVRRFFTHDPFGNRLEFMETAPAAGSAASAHEHQQAESGQQPARPGGQE